MSELANSIDETSATFAKYQVESNKMALDNLEQLWKPFLLVSRTIGVFPFINVNSKRKIRWWRNWWNLGTIIFVGIACYILYILIGSMLVNGVAKIIVGVDYLSYCAFYLHMLLSTVTFVYFLNAKPYLDKLCRLWSTLRFEQSTAAELNAIVHRKVKRNLAFTILGCLTYFFAIIVVHVEHDFYTNYTGLLVGLFTIWCLVANAVHLGLFCTVCRTSSYLLKSICEDLEAKIADDSIDDHLKWFRRVFVTFVDIIEASNQLFGRYVGFLVTFFLIETCCNTYLFFPYRNTEDILVMISDLIFVMEGLFIIMIVCMSAGEISAQELMLLLDCTNNLDTSICMFGIMPITKESLPMIFGIYLSYVFLLYQFPQDPDKASIVQDTSNGSISI